jgi:hypothetical protein
MDTERNSGSDSPASGCLLSESNSAKKLDYVLLFLKHSRKSIKRISFAKMKHMRFSHVMPTPSLAVAGTVSWEGK